MLEPWKLISALNRMTINPFSNLSLMSIGLEGEQSVASCLLPALGDTIVSLIGLRGLQERSSV